MSHRLLKVNELLKRELSRLISQHAEELGFIVVSDVITTKDLKNAKVYIRAIDLNEAELEKKLKMLQNLSWEFHRQIQNKYNLKFAPRFEFIIDNSNANVEKVEELLNQIENKPR